MFRPAREKAVNKPEAKTISESINPIEPKTVAPIPPYRPRAGVYIYEPPTKASIESLGISHGSLSNLLVDNHLQYLPIDGSRAMTGDLLPSVDGLFLGEVATPKRWDGSKLFFGQDGVLFTHPTYTPNLRLKIVYYDTLRLCHKDYDSYLYDFECRAIRPTLLIPSASPFDFSPWAGGIMRFIYEGQTAAEYYGALHQFSIPLAGDISLKDDKFIKIGKDSDGTLPTASADYRGKMIRTEGTGGSREDELWICMYDGAAYTWKKVTLT